MMRSGEKGERMYKDRIYHGIADRAALSLHHIRHSKIIAWPVVTSLQYHSMSNAILLTQWASTIYLIFGRGGINKKKIPCRASFAPSSKLVLGRVAVAVFIEGTGRKTKHPNTQLMFEIQTILVPSYKNKRDRSAITHSLICYLPRPTPGCPFPVPPTRHSASCKHTASLIYPTILTSPPTEQPDPQQKMLHHLSCLSRRDHSRSQTRSQRCR